jgi:hypothetical protein
VGVDPVLSVMDRPRGTNCHHLVNQADVIHSSGHRSWPWPQKGSEWETWFGRKRKLVKKNVKEKTVKKAKKKTCNQSETQEE